ncbi:MAG: hypothetical protein ACXVRH_13525 [Thermoleophilaceae bacterium]
MIAAAVIAVAAIAVVLALTVGGSSKSHPASPASATVRYDGGPEEGIAGQLPSRDAGARLDHRGVNTESQSATAYQGPH